jgi:hypothetical protein
MFKKNTEEIVNLAISDIEDKIKRKLETPDLGISEMSVAGLVSLISNVLTKLGNKKIITDDLIESLIDKVEKRIHGKIEELSPIISDMIADILFEVIEKIAIKLQKGENSDLMNNIILIILNIFSAVLRKMGENIRKNSNSFIKTSLIKDLCSARKR